MRQDPAELYKTLWKSAPWNDPAAADFRLRGHELKRQKAYLINSDDPEPCLDQEPSILLFYRFPGAQYGSLKAYRDLRNVPELNNIVADFNKNLLFDDKAVSINHAILTCYRGADDNISFHSDKVRDITPESPIISLSLGEKREFHFGIPNPINARKTVPTHQFVLNSGDCFILGPRTNQAYRHSIVPVSREKIIKRDPMAEVGPRISIVLRNISNEITRHEARKKAIKTGKARTKRHALKRAKLAIEAEADLE